jgi:bifunctional non-homologous end joining protein LigD
MRPQVAGKAPREPNPQFTRVFHASSLHNVYYAHLARGRTRSLARVLTTPERMAKRSRLAAGPPLPPQLASPAAHAPAGADWVHEIKYDGYRVLCDVRGGAARLWTRNGKDWTERFPAVAVALARLDVRNALLDAEIAVLDTGGRTSFSALQRYLTESRGELRAYLFDLLQLDGEDVRDRPLVERKELLSRLLRSTRPPLQYSDHVTGRGPSFHARACRMGLEGIISKRAASPYRSGRGRDWLKVKCQRVQEFVVVGYTAPQGSRSGFGALLLAGRGEDGSFRYVGRVGTGFSARQLVELEQELGRLAVSKAPVSNPPRGAGARGVTWVEPEWVVQVEYTEWTADGMLRHPSYKGRREDKSASEVWLEAEAGAEGGPVAEGGGSMSTKGSGRAGQARSGKGGTGGGRERASVSGVSLSNPHRVLYADQGITKYDLALYYETVAEWILPHIADRPLTLVRCPSGQAGECFYQKHMDESAHPAIHRFPISEAEGARDYGAVDSLAGLIALVQIGVLELHTWGSRRDRLEKPDRFTLDLDPDAELPWKRVVAAALEVRGVLHALGLESFVKTTGGKGLHVVVPIARRLEWDAVKEFTKRVSEAMAADAPGRYTTNISKAQRTGRILIDYLRNGRGATAVEAYSTRARPGAPVAVPVRWDELGPKLTSDRFDVFRLPRRLASLRADPWEGYFEVRQGITAAMRRAVGMR